MRSNDVVTRTYYEVAASGTGWQVWHGGQAGPTKYPTEHAAIAFASSAARFLHEETQKPSGVRVQGPGGVWRYHYFYGGDTTLVFGRPRGRPLQSKRQM
jgi:hypothetical protein